MMLLLMGKLSVALLSAIHFGHDFDHSILKDPRIRSYSNFCNFLGLSKLSDRNGTQNTSQTVERQFIFPSTVALGCISTPPQRLDALEHISMEQSGRQVTVLSDFPSLLHVPSLIAL